MNLEDGNNDEYIVTAHQIFQCCGADTGGALRVDVLMETFAPSVKTNKAEYDYLRSLLDPEQSNPEITVSMLAHTLNECSKNQKVKVDLDESFNLKNGQITIDSDSGISTDGSHIIEELQCELREKSRLVQHLRTQLDYADRLHEEAQTTATAERNSLQAQLHILREENAKLTHLRRDYEDVCERLSCSEQALEESQRELDSSKRRAKTLGEEVTRMENEKLNLQELLSRSKAECHRMNDLYASRQSCLLEENETLRTEHADLSARLRDQEEFMQQTMKEKMFLEMELKDMLNKSNHAHHRLERSIDVSCTDDQMLAELDSLNSETRFPQEQATVSTQAEIPCVDCVKRKAPHRSLRRYLWEPLKSLFQLFAVLCFIFALWLLCGLTRRWRVCSEPLPWRWLQPHDLLDLFLTIEYVSEVPM